MKSLLYVLGIVLALTGCTTIPQEKPADADQGTVFYPPLPATPRLQYLTTIRNEKDVGKSTGNRLDRFLFGEQKARGIVRAWDMGSSPGKLYIVDRELLLVIIIDLEAKTFEQLQDERLGKIFSPTGIFVTPEDEKYVSDMKRKQVVVFGRENEFLRTYGGPEILSKPLDVAVFQESVYVIDMEKHQLFVFDRQSGKLVNTIGGIGSEYGQFYRPTHVTVDREGNVFVNDAFNFRIQKFDAAGLFIRSYGYLGDVPGAFGRPKGIAVNTEGHLYVADSAFSNVQIFDGNTGDLLLFFGGAGKGRGKMWLPALVHIDYDNFAYFKQFIDRDFEVQHLVFVSNQLGDNKLDVYGYGRWIGPPTSGSGNAENEKVNANGKPK